MADIVVLPLCPRRNQDHDKPSDSKRKPDPPKPVPPVSSAPAREPIWRPRGRPAGSKNKPKPPIIITRDSANALKAHAMEVSSGCDVNESLTNFARKRQSGTLYTEQERVCDEHDPEAGDLSRRDRNPTRSVRDSNIHVGFHLAPTCPARDCGAHYLSGWGSWAGGGRRGGRATGGLQSGCGDGGSVHECHLQRLPLEDDDDEVVAAIQSHQGYQNGHHQTLDTMDLYNMSQTMVTNGSLPREMYPWASTRDASKN